MSRDPEEIRAEIDQTREELADTAAALAYKTDVKARAKDRVEEVKGDLREKVSGLKESAPDSAGGAAASVRTTARQNPIPSAAVAALVLGFTLGYLIARRR
jgi:ElaB/YqjD/DUF883 family membrane-anchored ribosome-binding protein